MLNAFASGSLTEQGLEEHNQWESPSNKTIGMGLTVLCTSWTPLGTLPPGMLNSHIVWLNVSTSTEDGGHLIHHVTSYSRSFVSLSVSFCLVASPFTVFQSQTAFCHQKIFGHSRKRLVAFHTDTPACSSAVESRISHSRHRNGKTHGCLVIVFCIAARTLRTMQLSLATQASIFSEDNCEA